MNRINREFIQGSIVALLGALVIGGANYFTRRMMANTLPTDAYAFFYTIFSLMMLLMVLGRVGTTEAAQFLIPRARAAGDEGEARAIVGWVCRAQVRVFMILGLLCLLASSWIFHYFAHGSVRPNDLIVFIPMLPLMALEGAGYGFLNAFKEFKAANIIGAAKALLVLTGMLLFLNRLGLPAAIWSYNVALLLAIVAAAVTLRRRKNCRWPGGEKRPGTGKKVMRVGGWLFAMTLGYSAINDLGTVVLAATSTPEEVALFNIALPIAIIARSLTVLPTVFIPLASELYAERRFRQIALTATAVAGVMLFGIAVAVPLFFWQGDRIITLLFNARFIAAKWSTLLLVAAMLFWNIAQFNTTILNAMNAHKRAVAVVLSAVAVAVALYLTLAPLYGATGCALATLIACALWALTSAAVLGFTIHRSAKSNPEGER